MATIPLHRFCSIGLLIFQLLLLPLTACALSINVSKDIEIRLLPLIGGPSFLPVHCRVVIQEDYGFDFVPKNPTAKETLQKLVSLQAVPADARIFGVPKDEDATSLPVMVTRAREFCTNYTKDLHLIRNNCWLFAYELIRYIQQEDDEII